MAFDGLGSSAGHIKGGRIKALMVAGNKRNPAIPDVPSAAEVGLPAYDVHTWYGLWAPKGTPPEVQAAAIVAFRLGQLAGLEIEKILSELEDLDLQALGRRYLGKSVVGDGEWGQHVISARHPD